MATSVEDMTSLRLPSMPASVPVARRRVQDWLHRNGVRPEQVEDARVVVSELVANSVRHARPLPDGTLLVAWRLEDGAVELSVTDASVPTVTIDVSADITVVAEGPPAPARTTR